MRISPAEDWVLADEGAGVECERSSGLPGAQVYIKFSWEIEEIEIKFNLEKENYLNTLKYSKKLSAK